MDHQMSVWSFGIIIKFFYCKMWPIFSLNRVQFHQKLCVKFVSFPFHLLSYHLCCPQVVPLDPCCHWTFHKKANHIHRFLLLFDWTFCWIWAWIFASMLALLCIWSSFPERTFAIQSKWQSWAMKWWTALCESPGALCGTESGSLV